MSILVKFLNLILNIVNLIISTKLIKKKSCLLLAIQKIKYKLEIHNIEV